MPKSQEMAFTEFKISTIFRGPHKKHDIILASVPTMTNNNRHKYRTRPKSRLTTPNLFEFVGLCSKRVRSKFVMLVVNLPLGYSQCVIKDRVKRRSFHAPNLIASEFDTEATVEQCQFRRRT